MRRSLAAVFLAVFAGQAAVLPLFAYAGYWEEKEREMRSLHFSPDAAYLFFNQASFDVFAGNNSLPPDAQNGMCFILSPSGSLTAAAARLFDILHTIDALPAGLIHAERPPADGLGAAINDRLSRASAGRGTQ